MRTLKESINLQYSHQPGKICIVEHSLEKSSSTLLKYQFDKNHKKTGLGWVGQSSLEQRRLKRHEKQMRCVICDWILDQKCLLLANGSEKVCVCA